MTKKVTQEDIARETKLSKYAVSRAIAGKSGTSDATRERVLEACRRLGYVRSTPKASSRYILLMIPKSDMNDPAFWMKVVQGVESGATKNGHMLHIKILRTSDDALTAQELESAAGVIFAGYQSIDFMHNLTGDKPAVLMSYPPHNMFQMDCLYCADIESSSTLCQKLLDWGHRRLLYCGDGVRPSAAHRLEGVKRQLALNGLELCGHLRESELQDIRGVTESWRAQKEAGVLPTALLCENDILVNLVVRAASQLQLRAPEDISIVSFNNDTREARSVSVTGMGLDKIGFGKQAVHMLFDRIARPDSAYKRIAMLHQFYDNHTAGPCREATAQPTATEA